MDPYKLLKILIQYNKKSYDELQEYRRVFYEAGDISEEQNAELIELIEIM